MAAQAHKMLLNYHLIIALIMRKQTMNEPLLNY